MEQTAQLKPEPRSGANAVAQSFLACLGNADHVTRPFDYWLLKNALPEGICEAIASLPFAPPQDSVFNGKRETNNSTRVYFTPENQANFDVCRRVAEGFKHTSVKQAIEEETGTDLSDTHLRIEYCQDTNGFWLEPHTDILVKKFTMLVYLSDDPNLALAGTDIHKGPPDFKYVGSAPYGRNLGVIFIPGKNSWHGVGHHPLEGIRKSIIINYVTSDWRDTWEFA
ncbi:MAG: 2OG-Fe(II) oxygenase [Methyloligellaceae bacterium]